MQAHQNSVYTSTVTSHSDRNAFVAEQPTLLEAACHTIRQKLYGLNHLHVDAELGHLHNLAYKMYMLTLQTAVT